MKLLTSISLAGRNAVLAAVIVWSSLAYCLHGANAALHDAWQSASIVTSVSKSWLPSLTVVSTPLTADDYRVIVEGIGASDRVTVSSSASGITIDANQRVDYESWRLVVDDVLLSNKAYRWQVKSLCAGDCQKVAFSAALQATKQSVVLNQ